MSMSCNFTKKKKQKTRKTERKRAINMGKRTKRSSIAIIYNMNMNLPVYDIGFFDLMKEKWTTFPLFGGPSQAAFNFFPLQTKSYSLSQ